MQPMYVTPNELCAHLGNDYLSGLKIFHLNAQSARNKHESLEIFFSQIDFEFDIIMLSETWFADGDDVFTMPGYNAFFLNRPTRRGGGVAILVKNEYRCEILKTFTCTHTDYEVLSLNMNKYVISVVYRPPSGSHTAFLSYLENLFRFSAQNKLETICGGDFNIDLICNSPIKNELTWLYQSFGLTNVIDHPTRVSTNSSTLLDFFLVGSHVTNIKAGVIACDLSDHLPIFMAVKQSRKFHKSASFVRNISSTNLNRFREQLATTDWTDVLSKEDASSAFESFLGKFKSLYDENFPYKRLKTPCKIRKPWMTPALLRKIKVKCCMYNEFLTDRDTDLLKKFKKYRNKLNKEIAKARNNYYNTLFEKCNGDSAATWRNLNSIFNVSKSPTVVTEVTMDGKQVKGSALANAFNDHLVNMTFTTITGDSSKYMNPPCLDTIYITPVTEQEVFSAIMQLNNSNSSDPFDMQTHPIKLVADMIATPLMHIFNICFSSGTFPSSLQIAKVVVIYKKGDKNNLGNYRPISILPIFSKVLEKLLHSRLTSFTDRQHTLTKSQYGFRKNCSTELALLDQKEFILEAIEDKKLVLGIFVDFSKAFDSLNRKVLLQKLESYGIRGVAHNIIESYLSNRTQYVSINNHHSPKKETVFGVPQGSILGPYLFNIYINDIVQIDPSVKFVIYADDTSLFISDTNCEVLFKRGNEILLKLGEWASCNGLAINTEKTKAVVFRAKNKQLHQNQTLFLNGSPIETVSSFKTLGVTFSENMLWDLHTDQVVTKLSRVTGALYRHRDLLPMKTRLLLYKSLFLPYIEYCFLVWGTTTSTNIHKLTRLQNRIIRNISNVVSDHPVRPLIEKLHLISIPNFYDYRLCKKLITERNKGTNSLVIMSKLFKNVHARVTRHPELWSVSFNRTTYGDNMLRSRIPVLLNGLHRLGKDIDTLSVKQVFELYLHD